MAKPTKAEAERLHKQITCLLDQGLSTNQIGRMLGKSAQAVSDYLRRHGLETAHMRRRRQLNIDKVTAEEEDRASAGGDR